MLPFSIYLTFNHCQYASISTSYLFSEWGSNWVRKWVSEFWRELVSEWWSEWVTKTVIRYAEASKNTEWIFIRDDWIVKQVQGHVMNSTLFILIKLCNNCVIKITEMTINVRSSHTNQMFLNKCYFGIFNIKPLDNLNRNIDIK